MRRLLLALATGSAAFCAGLALASAGPPLSGNNPTTTARYFYYDGGKPVLETDVSGTVMGINVFAPDGLVARYNGSVWRYFQFDQQGSVVHHLDASGNVSSSQMFEAYGQFIVVPGVLGAADCFRWNGRWGYYYDSETGIYLCGQRYMDPGQGRWLNRDPIGYAGGANLYGYCDGSPIMAKDPAGLFKINLASMLLKQLECDDLFERMMAALQIVRKRWFDMYNDKYDLYRYGSSPNPNCPWAGTWECHEEAYDNSRRNLRTLRMKYWEKCGGQTVIMCRFGQVGWHL